MNVNIENAIKARNKSLLKKIKISDRVRVLRSLDTSKLSFIQRREVELNIQLGLDQMAECEKDIKMFQQNIDRQMNELEE